VQKLPLSVGEGADTLVARNGGSAETGKFLKTTKIIEWQ
jgi:hypothetical protein